MKRILQIAMGIILAVVILAGGIFGAVMYYARPGGPYDQRLKQSEVELQQAKAQADAAQAKAVDARLTGTCLQQKAAGEWLTKDCLARVDKVAKVRVDKTAKQKP